MVSSATAIAGPIDLGSSIAESICTRPIRVPIIPMAGATSPVAVKTLAPHLWWSTVCCRSLGHHFTDDIVFIAVDQHFDAFVEEFVFYLLVLQRKYMPPCGRCWRD